MTQEFHRSNNLILWLDQQQDRLKHEIEELQGEIISRAGQNDQDLWEQVKAARHQADTMYEEKFSLIKKMFNLSQKFVQELEIQNNEQQKHIA